MDIDEAARMSDEVDRMEAAKAAGMMVPDQSLPERRTAKAEAISRLREVEEQIRALTPAKLFYGSNPPRKGETGHGAALPSIDDLADDVRKAREAVERL